MNGLRLPVLDLEVMESAVVRKVAGNEDEIVCPGYGGDLPVRERLEFFRPEPGAPARRRATWRRVRRTAESRWTRRQPYEDTPRWPFASRKPAAGGSRTATHARRPKRWPVAPDASLSRSRIFGFGRRTQRLGEDVGVQEVPAHKRTSRPGEGSRSKTSGSMPSRDTSKRLTKRPGTRSQNLSLPATRRRYSRTESMTATGSPRRVSSMRSLPSNSCTSAARSCLASAMEYRLDITHSIHGYLDSHFNLDRVPVNCRRSGVSRGGSGA